MFKKLQDEIQYSENIVNELLEREELKEISNDLIALKASLSKMWEMTDLSQLTGYYERVSEIRGTEIEEIQLKTKKK